jgi:ribosomal protein L37AE/L43A
MEEIVSEVLINDTTIASSQSTKIVQTPPAVYHQCKICGAPALHSNYGVMTCSPCKMFFKRNAEKGQVN